MGVKAIVTAAGGRMGGRIISLIDQTDGIELSGAVEVKGHPLVGRKAGEVQGVGKPGVIVHDDLSACIDKGDVIIDFTHHAASLAHVKLAAQQGRAIVIGTTGFSDAELQEIRKLAKDVRCVLAPNMSVGVNILFKVLQQVARILGDDYD
ncbi:MAG TPA: 4-hydroxy-tetrahydrodipicolinate reductase, partial [Syntrophus sp. (in: bacteria)]|nr:4-hydroxy-tetrahydrodipicolinate reductase [Syntrophus sp. (in: bacteria)]